MSRYWSETVKNIDPYVPGEQPRDRKYIKLNTNENPYPPSPKVIQAIKAAANSSLRLYPDPTCNDLREAVAQYYNVEKQQVYIGNGSDELLAFSFIAFFNPGTPILFPDITYSFYEVYCGLFNIDYRLVALDEKFDIPVEKFQAKNGGIVISNPNAPTGKYLPVNVIEKIVSSNGDNVVIIDEAYIDFGGESSVELVKEYPNILIMKTLSKSHSLAGLRLGFSIGNQDLIEGLDRVKNSINSYTVDRIALAGAIEAMKDEKYFIQTRQKIIDTRNRVSMELRDMGFNVLDSMANFIFISHSVCPADKLFEELKARGILVRYFRKPRIDNFLRVSIGTDEEMDSFLKAVSDIVPV